jgi:hypothetical protein
MIGAERTDLLVEATSMAYVRQPRLILERRNQRLQLDGDFRARVDERSEQSKRR